MNSELFHQAVHPTHLQGTVEAGREQSSSSSGAWYPAVRPASARCHALQKIHRGCSHAPSLQGLSHGRKVVGPLCRRLRTGAIGEDKAWVVWMKK